MYGVRPEIEFAESIELVDSSSGLRRTGSWSFAHASRRVSAMVAKASTTPNGDEQHEECLPR
jgi:hypothetical protein